MDKISVDIAPLTGESPGRMARKTTRRIEPRFGAPAPVDEIAAADDDRRARSGGDNRAGGGQKRRSGRKKPKKTARDRKSRSFLGRSFRSILYLGFACCVWGVIAVAGLVAYYRRRASRRVGVESP